MPRTIVNPLYKDTITFLQPSDETGGAYSFHELMLMKGGKNPPHIHTAFTETFTAVHGKLGLQLKDRKIHLHPGESYTVAKKEIHNFFNPGDEPITFNVLFRPGHAGMEQALCIAYGLVAEGLADKKGMPKNIYHAAIVVELSNSYPTGVSSLLRPILKMLANSQKDTRMKKILIDKYYNQQTTSKP